jgi:hypothetical protein
MKAGVVNLSHRGFSSATVVAATVFVALIQKTSSFAAPSVAVGSISALSGPVKIVRADNVINAQRGLPVEVTDKIETGIAGVVQVKFEDGTSFTLYENSSVALEKFKKNSNDSNGLAESVFNVVQGKLRFFVNPKAKVKTYTQFKSKTAIMGIRGTSGLIDVAPSGETQLVVLTGLVEVKNPKFPDVGVSVAPNFSTKVSASLAPTPPKPVSRDVIQSLLPPVKPEAGFTNDGPAAAAPSSGPELKSPQNAPKEQDKELKKEETEKPAPSTTGESREAVDAPKSSEGPEKSKDTQAKNSSNTNNTSNTNNESNTKNASVNRPPEKIPADEKKPQLKAPLNPVFEPGGKVINTERPPDSNKDAFLLPGGRTTGKDGNRASPTRTEGDKFSSAKFNEKSVGAGGNIENFPSLPNANTDIASQAQRINNSVTNTLGAIEKSIQNQVINPISSTNSSPQNQTQNIKVKVNINLPND